jgi:uncharacterized surface protein with fasciclin (FAS1) repeats
MPSGTLARSAASVVSTAVPARADSLAANGGTSVAAALPADAPYTVFAPSNEAFDAVAGVVATLTADQLRDVLLFHVLDTTDFPAPVLSTDLPAAAANLGTLNAANDIAYLPGPPPTFEGADIVSGLVDINVTNGVVHVIDAVMVP